MREPEGDPIGDGIYRRQYRGFLIDEEASGFTTLRDASGAELMNYDNYLDAEHRANQLEEQAEIDRAFILEDFVRSTLEAMIQRANQIPVPLGWNSQERRQLEAYRAIGVYIYGLNAWNAEWRKCHTERVTAIGPGESYDRR